MLFIAERAAEFAAISSSGLPTLCAIAPVLDSTKTVANVIIEAFIADVSLRSVDKSDHSDGPGSVAGNQSVRIDGGTDNLAPQA